MKIRLLIFCLIPLLNSYGQEIFFSKDSLSLDKHQIIDSLIISNYGTEVLRIDSIKCDNMNYMISIGENIGLFIGNLLEEFVLPENIIEIEPGDSVKLGIGPAAIVAKLSSPDYNWIDTMYFYNNSINNPIKPLIIIDDIPTGIIERDNLPIEYELFQNYPNPFNPSTTIEFNAPFVAKVELKIFDLLGRLIKRELFDINSPGMYKYFFDATKYVSGVYIYQIKTSNYFNAKTMLLLK